LTDLSVSGIVIDELVLTHWSVTITLVRARVIVVVEVSTLTRATAVVYRLACSNCNLLVSHVSITFESTTSTVCTVACLWFPIKGLAQVGKHQGPGVRVASIRSLHAHKQVVARHISSLATIVLTDLRVSSIRVDELVLAIRNVTVTTVGVGIVPVVEVSTATLGTTVVDRQTGRLSNLRIRHSRVTLELTTDTIVTVAKITLT
jgi:hypothetical protein